MIQAFRSLLRVSGATTVQVGTLRWMTSPSMMVCVRQFLSQLWLSRENAALTEMLVAGGTLQRPRILTGVWPHSPRGQPTFQTKHMERQWAMLTLTSSILAVGPTE